MENKWHRLDVTAGPQETILYVNGKEYAKFPKPLHAMTSPFFLGGDQPGSPSSMGRFVGEIDEMQMLGITRPASTIAIEHLNQSGS